MYSGPVYISPMKFRAQLQGFDLWLYAYDREPRDGIVRSGNFRLFATADQGWPGSPDQGKGAVENRRTLSPP